MLVLLARRRFPFAAPATTWLLCAALSFMDGQLIVNGAGILIAGMGAAVLLGAQRNVALSRLGLVIVAGGVVIGGLQRARLHDGRPGLGAGDVRDRLAGRLGPA